jgi:hypothetical protein
MVWILEPIEDCIVVSRQVEVDKDDDGNSIFKTVKRSRADLPSALQEIRGSLDLIQKQYEKDNGKKKS